jgi:glycosyltransferase involved in cell wall biosynthesis
VSADGECGMARAWDAKRSPVLGIVTYGGDLYSFVSVRRVWQQTIDLLSRDFPTRIYTAPGFDIDCNSPGYRRLLRAADLLVVLSPYFHLNRELKDMPAIVYALGSLQKGGHWLYWNKESFRPYDTLVLNSSVCHRIYQKIVGHSALQPAIVPLAADPDVFYPRGDSMRTRRRYGLPLEAVILIFAGRISFQKNCHVLLSALHEIRKRYNVHLLLLGFYDNYYIPEFSEQSPADCQLSLQAIIQRYNLSAHVTVIDHHDDQATVAEIMSACDVGVNLSTLVNENFGLAPVEMQLCGLPVICSHWGGMKDTILHGETGFHVDTVLSSWGPRVNYEQAIHFLEELILDPHLRQRLGERGRWHAQVYTLPRLAKDLHGLIYRTLHQAETVNSRSQFVIHPVFERFYQAVAERNGKPRDLTWEHLRPAIGYEAYQLVVSECATCDADDVQWTPESRVNKAFDWEMPNAIEWVSRDPRWNPYFELVDFALTPDELRLLWQIQQGHRDVRELTQEQPWRAVSRVLCSLTSRGLILPGASLVEQRLPPGKVHSDRPREAW